MLNNVERNKVDLYQKYDSPNKLNEKRDESIFYRNENAITAHHLRKLERFVPKNPNCVTGKTNVIDRCDEYSNREHIKFPIIVQYANATKLCRYVDYGAHMTNEQQRFIENCLEKKSNFGKCSHHQHETITYFVVQTKAVTNRCAQLANKCCTECSPKTKRIGYVKKSKIVQSIKLINRINNLCRIHCPIDYPTCMFWTNYKKL